MIRKVILFVLASFCSFADPIIIGIAGGSGAGKTTIANKLYERFKDDALIITQDNYYKDLSHLTLEERAKSNFDHPDSIDFDMLENNLKFLKKSLPVYQPEYDFSTHSRKEEYKTLYPKKIIIVEGILLLSVKKIRDLFDVKIFVQTNDDIRILRRIERDIVERGRTFESVKKQYFETVYPMYWQFVEPSKRYADFIIPYFDFNATAVDLVVSRLESHLKE